MSFVWLHEKPQPGRAIRDTDLRFPSNMHTKLSIGQAMKNAEASRGEGFFWTCDIAKELPIRIADSGPGSEPAVTVMDAFAATVRRCSSLPALAVKPSGATKWQVQTWQEYWSNVCGFAKSLIAIGMKDRQCTSIMGFNHAAWHIAHFGSIFANGVPTGIYTTNGVDATKYIIDHTQSVVAVCDTVENMKKFLAFKKQCPSLKYIVIYMEEPPKGSEKDGVIRWADFMKLGRDVKDKELTKRMEVQRPGHCCSLVYTSGTTGPPKGVMLSHDNVVWTARLTNMLSNFSCEDVFVSFLPLSHIAAQVVDIYNPIICGASVHFAQPDALKGSLVNTLQEVRPTFFFAVPRVWEKIEEKMRAVGAANTGLKKRLGDWAKKVGLEGTLTILNGHNPPMGFSIAQALVFNRVRQGLGLDRCRGFGTGAAPMPKATQEYFLSLAMPIGDLFGMSECTGPETFSLPAPGWFKLGSIGRPVPGTEILIQNPDGKGNGEICWRGRNVFMGYYKNDEATRQTMDEFGFLHSGDIGTIDKDGFIFITGRIKELLITAGGENIPPVLIENVFKEEFPLCSNCQLIGDGKKYLSLLVCIKSQPDADGHPTKQLAADVIKVLQANGSQSTTTEMASTDPVVHRLIAEAVKKVNAKAISKAQHIHRWRVLPSDFTQQGGELTPTLKLKRKFTTDKYTKLIEDMYAAPEDSHPGGLTGDKAKAAAPKKPAAKL